MTEREIQNEDFDSYETENSNGRKYFTSQNTTKWSYVLSDPTLELFRKFY